TGTWACIGGALRPPHGKPTCQDVSSAAGRMCGTVGMITLQLRHSGPSWPSGPSRRCAVMPELCRRGRDSIIRRFGSAPDHREHSGNAGLRIGLEFATDMARQPTSASAAYPRSASSSCLSKRRPVLGNLDHRLGERLRGLLRQVVADAAADGPMLVWTAEL